MSATLSALVAVAGTLLGSLSTYLIQRFTLRRSEEMARADALRQQRRAAYADFAERVMRYRHVQFERGRCRRQDSHSAGYAEVRTASFEARAGVWQALFHVRLIADSADITELADRILEKGTDIHRAPTKEEMLARGSEVRGLLEEFMALVSRQVL